MVKTIGVISLKGGVGKTSTVVSLGAAFFDIGKKVLLVDGNFSSPTLGLHLNVIDPRETLHHVLSHTVNVNDVVHNLDYFDLLPSSIFSDILINPLQLKDKIKNLKWKYDVVILDSSPSLNDETLAVILASDKLIVVTTPDFPTLSTTMKAVKFAKQRGTPISGLVVNKCYNKNFELSLNDIEEISGVPILAVIPYDKDFLKALSEFSPYTVHKPRSEGSEEYRRLAATLIGEEYKPLKLKRFLRWINPQKQDINRTIYYKEIFNKNP